MPPAKASATRHAVCVDPVVKQNCAARLKRIEGQVHGIAAMIDDERWCGDVLAQINAVQQALRSVGREVIRNHLKHCVTDAAKAGGAKADAVYDELVDLFYKNAK